VLRELDIDLGTKTVVFTGAEIPLSPATSTSDLTAPGDGTFSATFEMVIEALGDFPLWDLQVTDDLTTEFGTLVTDTPDAPGEYAVTSARMVTLMRTQAICPTTVQTRTPTATATREIWARMTRRRYRPSRPAPTRSRPRGLSESRCSGGVGCEFWCERRRRIT